MANKKPPTKNTPIPRRSWGSLRTMRSGRIQASYVADDGRRYYCSHTFDTRMDAEGWLQNERRLIDRDDWTPPEVRAKAIGYITLGDYSEQWFAHRDLSPTTRSNYRQILQGRINNHLGDELLQAITPAMIRARWVALPKDTRTRNAHAYRVLNAVFNTAIEDKLVTANPCQIKSAGRFPKGREVQA